jgi:hypothetical protein
LILVWPDWGSNWPQSTTLDRTDHNLPHSSGTDHNLPHSIELTTIYHTRVEVFHNLPHSSGSVQQSTTLEWKHAKYYTMDVVLILYSQKCSESNRFSLLVHLPKGRINVTGRPLSLTISQFNVLLLEQVESNYTKMIIGKGAIHIYTSFGRSQKVSLAGRNYDNINVNYTGLYKSLFF